MGWSLYFVVLCAAFCFARTQGDNSFRPPSHLRESGELFDIGSCTGENCGDYGTSDKFERKYPKPDDKLPGPVYPNEEDYEPQYPDPEMPGSNEYEPPIAKPEYPTVPEDLEFCPDICKDLLKTAKEMDNKHPDISEVKCYVIKELLRIISFYSVVRDGCHPTVKLLDLIILAADKLKNIYSTGYESSCEYTEIPITTEPSGTPATIVPTDMPVYTSTEYEPETSSYHKGTSERDTDYSTSKDPCSYETEAQTTLGYEGTMKSHERPSHELSGHYEPADEITAEDEHELYPPFVGSLRGIPGEHYPDYTEVPITSFSCADKKYIPGFYADLETSCQVFHVCYEHRRESFLCPVGTIFNQPILACDYWYSSNCSLAPVYYEVNNKAKEISEPEEMDSAVGELITSIMEDNDMKTGDYEKSKLPHQDLEDIVKFLPVKAKVTVFTDKEVKETKTVPQETIVQDVSEVASDIFDDIVSTATRITSKTRDVIAKIPEPTKVKIEIKPESEQKFMEAEISPAVETKITPVAPEAELVDKLPLKAAVPVDIKAKLATALPVIAAVPVLGKAKIAAAAIPVAKVVAAKAAVPLVVKAKIAAAVPVAKLAAAKVAVPIAAKAKIAAAAIPVAKAVAAKAAVPLVVKAKMAAAVPVAKLAASKVAIPILAKAKVGAVGIPVAAKSKLVAGKVIAAKAAVPLVAKAKLSAVPFAAKSKLVAGKVVAAKAAVPLVAKAKLAAAAVPVAAKFKLVAGKVVAAKAAVPLVAKAKLAAVAVPVAAKAAVPLIVKAKVAATVPVAKMAAAKVAVPIVAKTKVAAVAVPVAAKYKLVASKVVASKVAIPVAKTVAAKAKLTVAVPAAKVAAAKSIKVLGAKAAVPIVIKSKVAATFPFVKAAGVKASVPALKTKILAASMPFAKSFVLKSVPLGKAKIFAPALKAKAFKAASIPIVKGKLLALPLAKAKFAAPLFVKAKLAKAVAISPLTKKALALGYMKLLKAKKLALMG